MAIFRKGDDHIEGRERALELDPELAAAPGDIRRLRRLGKQTLVAGGQSRKETILDLFDGAAEFDSRELQAGLLRFPTEAFQERAPPGEGGMGQRAAVQKEQVESHEADGQVRAGEQVDLLAAEALLKF